MEDVNDEFTALILGAHKHPGESTHSVVAEPVYELALAAGEYALQQGWDPAAWGVNRNRVTGQSLSAEGGLILLIDGSGRQRSYPTSSVTETLGLLVTAGILPARYSPHALGVLEDLEIVFDRAGDRLEERGAAQIATGLRNAAETTAGFLAREHSRIMSLGERAPVAV